MPRKRPHRRSSLFMTSPLHQITMSFTAEEDRMLLRISTTEKSEYQLWLTRRFVKVLWKALIQTLERDPDLKKSLLPEVKDAMMSMRHQEAVNASEFEKPHIETNRDLTSNSGPLLVTNGTVTPLKPGLTQLAFNTADGKGVNFSLNDKLLHALCHLIISTSQKAEWGLDLMIGDPAVVVPKQGSIH
jgi:hypothetical protein